MLSKLLSYISVACLLVLTSTSGAYAIEIVREKLSLNGYFDATAGDNRYNSGTTSMDAYHWVMIFKWHVTENIEVTGDITFEHGPQHTGSGNKGDIKTRSYVTLLHSDALKLNIGKFLAPFGEQNLYHDATPAYISVSSPRSIYWKRKVGSTGTTDVTDRLFAKEGAGIWLWGNTEGSLRIDYDIYVINGHSGTTNEYQTDDNDNKGVGGKAVLSISPDLSIGGSFYAEKDGRLEGDAGKVSWAAQANYMLGNADIRGEYMKGRIDAHAALPKAKPDAFYVQLSYTVEERYTPYVRYDSYENDEYGEDEHITTVGINYMIHPKVYLKGEYGYYRNAKNVTQLQIAVAY